MYQLYNDIFEKLIKYLVIARELKEDIQEVHVYNSIELVFGKKYCRIYVDFKLKNERKKAFELQELRYKYFNNVGISDYFSFYLGYDDYQVKEDRLKNKEEEIHYEYIWNFLAWQMKKEEITVKPSHFISEYYEKIKRKEEDEKWENEKKQILNEISNYLKENQDLLFVVKDYNKIRIGKIAEFGSYNSLTLLEIKKDLSIGKVKVQTSNYNTIAIINVFQLPKLLTKDELVKLINSDVDFEGLIWKKK